MATGAIAQTRTFDGNNDADGGDGTNWSQAVNWSGDDVPNTAGEDAVIDPGGVWSVILNGTFTIDDLTMGSDDLLTIGTGRVLQIDGG
jgi:hypothetical protein